MKKWQKVLIGVFVALIIAHAPWRVATTVAEAEWMKPAAMHLTKRNDAYWKALALEARLTALGYSVRYAPNLNYMGQQAYGLTDRQTREILVDETLHWNDRYAVLAHEGGHVLQPGWLGSREADVFAEMVSAVMTGESREAARWLSGAKLDVLVVGVACWPEIYHAAAVLSE